MLGFGLPSSHVPALSTPSNAIRLRTHRTDGKTGTYSQDDPRRAAALAARLDPQKIFCSGPIVIGVLNPFSVLSADEVCWIEVDTVLPMKQLHADGVERVVKLPDRKAYEEILARQWPLWRKAHSLAREGLLEALVELSFRGGDVLYLRVFGIRNEIPLVESFFGVPAITAEIESGGAVYANPRCIVRARVYHSAGEVSYPDGLWFAEADDI